MTDKVQKIRKEVEKLHGNPYYMMAVKDVLEILDSLQEEPVKDRFTFKAITRLLDMIEPTDRAKSYVGKLADSFDSEGYHTDAKIVRESLKIMNGEKVAMATMDEEPVSMWHNMDEEKPPQGSDVCLLWPRDGIITISEWEGLENTSYVSKWAYKDDLLNFSNLERTVKNWKEPVSEELELEEEITKCYKSRVDLMMTRKQFGEIIHRFTEWQKEQIMKDATDVTVHIDAGNYPYIPQLELYDYDNDVALAKEGDKYKVVLIKEE